MLGDEKILQQKYGDSRPGFELLDIVDAALPVTVVGTDVLAQERKPLPLLDEFVLRFLSGGIDNLDELASFLGLTRDLVESSIADQVAADNVRYSSGSGRITL